MMRRLLVLAGLLAGCTLPVMAAEWRSDPAASRLEFSASFEGATAPGVFRVFSVRMTFDADRPADSALDVAISVSSADMNSAEVNKAIAGAEWFDFARFPQAVFRASDLRRVQAGRYVARGTLRLKGRELPVELPFTWSEAGGRAKLAGEIVLKRAAFGIGTGEWAATSVIGADVKVRFDVTLHRNG